MAISRISGGSEWVEIASNSPTAVQTVSFTSLPAYKDYRVVGFDLSVASSPVYLRFDNGTTNYAYISAYGAGGDQSEILLANSATYTTLCFDVIIEQAQAAAKKINYWSTATSFYSGQGWFNVADAISEINLVASANFTDGKITVFGRR